MGLKEDILGHDDRTLVPVRAFGRDLYVRVLSGAERDDYEQGQVQVEFDQDGKRSSRLTLGNLRARLAVKALADADGNRIFGDQDAEALGRKDGRDLEAVFMAAARLNGLKGADVEEAKKNSASDPPSASGSASPSPSA